MSRWIGIVFQGLPQHKSQKHTTHKFIHSFAGCCNLWSPGSRTLTYIHSFGFVSSKTDFDLQEFFIHSRGKKPLFRIARRMSYIIKRFWKTEGENFPPARWPFVFKIVHISCAAAGKEEGRHRWIVTAARIPTKRILSFFKKKENIILFWPTIGVGCWVRGLFARHWFNASVFRECADNLRLNFVCSSLWSIHVSSVLASKYTSVSIRASDSLYVICLYV